MERRVKFWGVRGSLSAGPSQVATQTSCVELEVTPTHSIFFDAGSGIHAASQNRKFEKLTLCLSHFHWDHIQGFPFIEGLYDGKFKIEIFSGFRDTKERLQVLFDERFFPVAGDFLVDRIQFHFLEAGQEVNVAEGLKLALAPLNHPGTSHAFRIRGEMSSFVFATDSDYDPLTLQAEKLFENAEYLVVDSQFLIGDSISKAHYGHSSFKRSIDVAARTRSRNCVLFHYDPKYSDEELFLMEAQALDYVRTSFGERGPNIILSKDGLTLNVPL